jgi:hypothetical protein
MTLDAILDKFWANMRQARKTTKGGQAWWAEKDTIKKRAIQEIEELYADVTEKAWMYEGLE